MTKATLRGETNNLPADLTTFVGRRREIAEVRRLLSSARLVTLTGVGGIGKTRLALAVSRKLRRALADGVWLVELAALATPELVDQAMLQALGLRGLPTRRNIDALTEFLQDKQALLVLDNCEHLLVECAAVVGRLLRACPGLRILATSREPLRVIGEHTFTVPPLTVPNPADSVTLEANYHYDAMTLFVERAKEIAPTFALTDHNRQILARVCARLDGVPLAIELATARVRTLSLEQILGLLDNQPELLTAAQHDGAARHQTMRTAMEWSFQLCTPEERLLWARLSLFADGFDVAAAENVCAGRGLDQDRIMPLLSALIDKSILVRQDHPHAQFRQLETVRQYGREQLVSGGEETAWRHRHRDYYRDLVEHSASQWYGPDQYALSARIRDALPNIRVALDTCLTDPATSRMGLQIAGALWFYWTACEYPTEGRRWLERALALEPQPCRERARALWAYGYLAVRRGEFDTALSIMDKCRVLNDALGDQELGAAAAVTAGMVEVLRNNVRAAAPLLRQATDWYQASGTRTVLAPTALALLAICAMLDGELDQAVAFCDQARILCQEHGERWALAFVLWDLGLAHLMRGEHVQAGAAARAALTIRHDMNDVFGIVLALELIAWIAADVSEPERAARLIGGSARLWQPVGAPLYGSECYLSFHEACVRRARRDLGDRDYHQAVHSGRNLDVSELIAYAYAETGADHTASSSVTRSLTQRELEIAELVSEGLSNRQIAGRLLISLRTAEGHVQNILTKLGFTSRVQIATWAAQRPQ